MIRSATWNKTAARRQFNLSGHGIVWISDFLAPTLPAEGEAGSFPLPQAFLVEQSPDSAGKSHWHDEDQFQVVTQGSGAIGRHEVTPHCVHYSNRQTGYGPVIAHGQGIAYFTLRQIITKGTWYLEDSKDLLDRQAPKRQLTSEPINALDADALKALRQVVVQTLIAPQDDGMAAWLMQVPGGTRVTAPVTREGTGRYFVVVGGTLQVDDAVLPRLATVFVSHDEANFTVQAGAAGLEVMVLQYPGGERVVKRRAQPASGQGPAAKRRATP